MDKNLRLTTLNVKGLGSVIKRRRIEQLLNKEGSDIIFLQETHQAKEGVNEVRLKWSLHYEKSLGTSKKNGVAILISKRCGFIIKEIKKDDQGRYIMIKGLIEGEIYTLINVYTPNVKHKEFFTALFKVIEEFREGYVILAGDFNMVMNNRLDRSNPTSLEKRNNITILNKLIREKDYVDGWRWLRGGDRGYTYYSPVHKSYSRIDYVFVSKEFSTKLCKMETGVIKVTDHAMLSLDFMVKKDYREAYRWKLNTRIFKNNKAVERMQRELSEIWEVNEKGGSAMRVVWDTMKAVTRGICIREACIMKKQQLAIQERLEEKIRELEEEYWQTKNKRILIELQAKKKELENKNLEEVQRNIIYMKREFFENSNKNSRLLARLTQKEKAKNSIGIVKDRTGNCCFTMKGKIKIFQEFYQELYKGKEIKKEKLELYIGKYLKKKLEIEHKELMERSIIQSEIEEAIEKLKVGKSPGVDGLGPEYYKTFKALLIPKLLKLYNAILEGERIPESWYQSLIILIPKADKDLTIPDSYRPISLINQDAKIFSSILARRMNKFIGKYIGDDQCGFIAGRYMHNLVGRVLNVIHEIKELKKKAGILALDIFKAFDCVSWQALKTIINKMGFGDKFKLVIDQLYSQNTAIVVINDGVTDKLQLTRGTRQGCPLSPVLFVLVMELLANVIREDEELEGIGRSNKIKINMFADDTMLTIKNLPDKMGRIGHHLKDFEEITGLKINWSKSEMMLFNYTKKEEKEWEEEGMEIKIKDQIKYLGVIITKDLEKLGEQNLNKLKREIMTSLNNYKRLNLSWFGKIAVVKMKIIPKINFLFRMLPIKIDEIELKNWQNIINNYCNGGKKARINKSKWYLTQKKGGLGLPNIKLYYVANRLRHIVEAIIGVGELEWLEDKTKTQAKLDWKLENIFFKEAGKKWLETIGNPLLKLHCEIWSRYKRGLLSSNSPLIPVIMLKNFPENLKNKLNKILIEKNKMKLGDWLNGMTTRRDLEKVIGGENLTWLNYWQLEQWTQKWIRENGVCREISKFEELIIKKGIDKVEMKGTKGITSEIYRILLEEGKMEYSGKMVWETDLRIQIGQQRWEGLWRQRVLRNMSVRIRENYYKIVWRWYLTPVRLNMINKQHSVDCWRGCGEKGTYLHMWWECKFVKKLWKMVFKEIDEIVEMKVEEAPKVALLSLLEDLKCKNETKELISNLLTAARLMISRNWKIQGDYCIEDWYKEVWNIAINDKLTCNVKVRRGLTKANEFNGIWKQFLEFVFSKGSGIPPPEEVLRFWKQE